MMSLVSFHIFKTEKIYAARVFYVCLANISKVLYISSFLSVGLGGEKEQEYQFPSQEDILSL